MPESHSTDKVAEEKKTPEKEPDHANNNPKAENEGSHVNDNSKAKAEPAVDQEMVDTSAEPPSKPDVEMTDDQPAETKDQPKNEILEPEPKFENKNISKAMEQDEEMINTSQALVTDSNIKDPSLNERKSELEDLEKSELSESMGFDPAFGRTLSLDAMRGMTNIPQRQGRSESNPILTSFWKNNDSLDRNLNSGKDYMKLEDRGFIRHLMLEGNYDKVMEIMQEKYQNVLNIDPRIKESLN